MNSMLVLVVLALFLYTGQSQAVKRSHVHSHINKNVHGETAEHLRDCNYRICRFMTSVQINPHVPSKLTREQIDKLILLSSPDGHTDELPVNFTTKSPFTCIDGRIDTPEIKSPGGDAGEFLLMMRASQQLLYPIRWDDEMVTYQYFSEFVLFNRGNHSFYMHTDKEHVTKLRDVLRVIGYHPLDDFNPIDLGTFGDTPQSVVLGYLVMPAYTGCGHIAKQLEKPTEYGWATALPVQNFIRAFFNFAWNPMHDNSMLRFDIDFPVLVGEHDEQVAIRNVTTARLTNPNCPDENTRVNSYLPGMVTMPTVNHSYFVNHNEHDKKFGTRGQLVSYIGSSAGFPDMLINLMNTLSPLQQQKTLDLLGKGMDVIGYFEVHMVLEVGNDGFHMCDVTPVPTPAPTPAPPLAEVLAVTANKGTEKATPGNIAQGHDVTQQK